MAKQSAHDEASAVAHDAVHGDVNPPEVEAVAAHTGEAEAHHPAGPMDVSAEMFFWTLGTFAVIAYILGKVAWKPILEGLEHREASIRQSVENAETLEQELASIEDKRATIVAEADAKASDIIGRARKAGMEAERVITDKAKQQADILRENVERDIAAASDKAAAALRKDSVEAAITLAGKILGEELDEAKQRQLTDNLIADL